MRGGPGAKPAPKPADRRGADGQGRAANPDGPGPLARRTPGADRPRGHARPVGNLHRLQPRLGQRFQHPFRHYKSNNHEGGIATPLIVHWPKGIAARDELRHRAGHLIDIMPTCVELAGAD